MGGNLSVLENTFKYFIQSQTEQNNILMKITKNHDNLINKLPNQGITQDVHASRENQSYVDTTRKDS
jgi:hypothetical protein